MTSPFNRKHPAALLLAMVCVLALAGASWHAIVQLREDVALTQHTREVQNQLGLALITLLDVEKSHHALLLTQNTADFEPYLVALRRLHADMDVLAALTATHTEQTPEFARLQALVQRWRDELTRAIQAQPTPNGQTVLADARNGDGKAVLTQIRDVLERMDHEQARALAAYQVEVGHQLQLNMLLGAAVTAVTTAMLVSIYLLMRRESAARDRAERAQAGHRQALEHDIELRSRELAQASEALTISEARQRGIFDSATDAILTVDQSQTIVLANPAAARMLRCSQQELVGSALERFVPPALRVRHRRHIEAFGAVPTRARTMSPQREVSGQRSDGEEFPIEAAISRLHIGGQELYTVILRDITERKRAEAGMRRSETRFRDVLMMLPEPVFIEGGGRISFVNEAAQRLAGLSEAELLGRAPLSLCHPDSVEVVRARIDRLSRGMACHVSAEPAAARRAALSADVQTCLYRVAQESLNNVVKHAQASEVRIELARAQTEGFVLRVRDNGSGMAPGSHGKPDSFGLLGMQERLRLIGGSLQLHSQQGSGTTVEARVPTGCKQAVT